IYDDNGDKVASRIDRLTNTINSLHLKFKIEGEAQVGDTWTYETSGEDTDTIHIEVDENFGEMSVTNGLSGKKLTMLAEDGKTVVISVTNPGTFKEAGDFEQTHGNGNAVLDTPTLGENILRGTYTIQYNENPVGVFDSNDNNQGDAIVKNFTYEDPTHISDSYTLTYKGPAVDEFVPGDNLGNATLSNATFGNSILQAEYSLEYVGATAGAFLAGNNNGSAVLIHATYGDEILQGEYTITYDGTKWLLTDPNNIVYEMQQGTEENVFISDALGFTVCTGQAREGDTYTCYVTKWRCQDEFGRTIILTETAPNTFTSTSIGFTVENAGELVETDTFTANVTKWEMKDANQENMILKESARGKFTAQIEDQGNIIDVFEYEIIKGKAEVNDTYTCLLSQWSMTNPLGEQVALVENNGIFTSESLGFTIASGTAEYGDTFTCEVELKENTDQDASDFRVLKVGAQFDSSSTWDIHLKNLVLQGGKVGLDDQGGSGGVLYLHGAQVDLELDNIVVSNGVATKAGGGIYSFGYDESNIIINDSIIKENIAKTDGGGFYNEARRNQESKITMDNVDIYDNTAGRHGGGMYFYCERAVVDIQESTFNNNEAGNNGGGMLVQGVVPILSIYDSEINNNTAKNGAGISIIGTTSSELKLEYSTVLQNKATGDGGGIYSSSNANTVEISKTNIGYNEAKNGAGIYAYSDAIIKMYLDNASIYENIAQEHGGGIYSYVLSNSACSTQITIENTTIADNVAVHGKGAGVYNIARGQNYNTITVARAILAVENSTITGNIAGSTDENAAAGIYNYSWTPVTTNYTSFEYIESTVYLVSSIVYGNYIGTNASDIYVDGISKDQQGKDKRYFYVSYGIFGTSNTLSTNKEALQLSTLNEVAMEEGIKNLFQYEIGEDEQGNPIYAGVYKDNAGRWRAHRVISTSAVPLTEQDTPQYSVQTARINIHGYAAYYGTLIGKRYYIDDANDKQTMYYFYNQVTGMWTSFKTFPEGHKLYEFTQPCKFDRNNADGTYGLRSGYTGETGAGTPGEFIDETNVRTLAENFNDEGKQISRVNTLIAFHAGAHALTM
ncbi:MAG TPA: hypothetical protein P5543_11725, partial [Planctomycetota bacterium]|nr:hypothetical protein [Planctomycetota bacterium]